MAWQRAAALLAALAVSAPAIARARGPRTGWYVSASMDVGGGVSRESAGRASNSYASLGLGLDGAIGYAPVDGLALAGEARLLLQGDVVSRTLGGLADWYPEPAGPWHVELGFGQFAGTALRAYSQNVAGGSTAGDPIQLSGVSGVLGHAGVGYAFRAAPDVAFSPVFDVYRVRATNARDASYDAYGASIELTLTWL